MIICMHCTCFNTGKGITKRKLYNTDISSQIPENTARWQNSRSIVYLFFLMQYSTGQPSVSDVLDDNIPDVPDEHEPVNGMYLLIGLCVLIF